MLDAQICRYVFALGITPRHKGFGYICEAVSRLLKEGAVPDAESALSCVCAAQGLDRRSAERCMRYAVRYAWDSGSGNIRASYGTPPAPAELVFMAACELACSDGRPQNAQPSR